MKKIIYIDMDNVLVDFKTGIEKLDEDTRTQYEGRFDEVPHIFSLMDPMEGSITAINLLALNYELFILSTSPWLNPTALQDKLDWIKTYFGDDPNSIFYKKVIFTHRKDLLKGDYLIDDRTKNGAGSFEGKLVQYGNSIFSDWDTVLKFLLEK
jgi:5'-nucleotidase